MKSISIYELQAELCRALSHSVRLEIIHTLRDGPKRVSDLARIIGLNQATVSRHLGVLKSNGILTTHHQGREIYYQIIDSRIPGICDLMRQVLVEQSVRQSRVLKTFNGTAK